jgi:hypothetical protein
VAKDVFQSATRSLGDFAGVFEYDGDAAYFYLYSLMNDDGQKIVGAVHLPLGEAGVVESDVKIKWDEPEEKVELFLRNRLWAIFNLKSGQKAGGYGGYGDTPFY